MLAMWYVVYASMSAGEPVYMVHVVHTPVHCTALGNITSNLTGSTGNIVYYCILRDRCLGSHE